MILTSHAIIGSAISNLVPDAPAFGFVLAFAGHYLTDMIPHYDYNIDNFIDHDTKAVNSIFTNVKARLSFLIVVSDFIFALFLTYLIFVRDEKSLYATLAGAIGGVLPDLLQFFCYYFKKWPWTAIQKIHKFFHNKDEMRDRPVRGFVTQIIVVFFVLFVYFLIK